MSPRKLFEQELEELRQDVLQMAEWVQDGYDCLFAALEKKDGDQMRRYVRHDRTIEDMQRNIESQCLSLLTRQTPVARDLRTVSAALKVVTDLERIGNHLSDMAELFVRMGMGVEGIWWAVCVTTIAKGLILLGWFTMIRKKCLNLPSVSTR